MPLLATAGLQAFYGDFQALFGIDFEIAGVGSRMLAAVVDVLLMSFLLLVAVIAPFLLIATARDAAATIGSNLTKQEQAFKDVNVVVLGIFLIIPQFLKPIYFFRLRVIGIGLRTLYGMAAVGFLCVLTAALVPLLPDWVPAPIRAIECSTATVPRSRTTSSAR